MTTDPTTPAGDAAAIPPDCDVRRIMLRVVPGPEGEGVEVYAKNVGEVDDLLASLWEKIDDLEFAARQNVNGATP